MIPYLEAENRYTEEVMAPTKSLQETLYHEILGRIQETDVSVPVKRDDYFYYTRTEEGKAYSIHCRKRAVWMRPKRFCWTPTSWPKVRNISASETSLSVPIIGLLAYSTDFEGDEAYTIQVKDLATGELLPDRIAEHLLHARMGQR